jgi:hypothetical protein
VPWSFSASSPRRRRPPPPEFGQRISASLPRRAKDPIALI